LSREKVREVISEYEPLARSDALDAFLLVTRNGLHPSAAEALSLIPRARHLTEREILEAVFSAEALLRAAEEGFRADGLAGYYQPAETFAVDLDLATSSFDVYYSADADAAISRMTEGGTSGSDPSLTEEQRKLLGAAVADRLLQRRVSLIKAVTDWLKLPAGPTTRGLALLGSYGTGKSSFAKALVASQANAYRSGRTNRVPVLIELRHFGSHQSLEGLVTDHLANRVGVTNAAFSTFSQLNKSGRLLIVLDGFDEMKEGMTRDALIYNFAELNRLLDGDAKVVLCGRPTVFENQDEQRAALAGSYADAMSGAVPRYVRYHIAPMSPASVRKAISAYVDVHRADLGPQINQWVERLEADLRSSKTLRQLLSRPVHYPMLLKVLPGWQGSLPDLTRTALYEAFIEQTIAREMKPGRLPTIPAEQRARFATDLATFMFAQGESRSIRYAAIPDAIVTPHRRGTESLEATRRDLVKSCFLESKPPDILFFPHKSFGEYLVAGRFAAEASRAPATDKLGVALTPEIASFLDEQLSTAAWAALLRLIEKNTHLVRYFFQALAERSEKGALAAPPQEEFAAASLREALRSERLFLGVDGRTVGNLPHMLQFYLAEGIERTLRLDGSNAVGPSARPFLRTLAFDSPDHAAIHAFRALALAFGPSAMDFMLLAKVRWTTWYRKGLVAGPMRLDGLARDALVESFERTSRQPTGYQELGIWRRASADVACSVGDLSRLGVLPDDLARLGLRETPPETMLLSGHALKRLGLDPASIPLVGLSPETGRRVLGKRAYDQLLIQRPRRSKPVASVIPSYEMWMDARKRRAEAAK
jgi:hypothetical protein